MYSKNVTLYCAPTADDRDTWLPDDGSLVRPTVVPRQIGEERLSSVHYVRFDTGGRAPVAIGCDHPELAAEATLTDAQRRALEEDLRAT